LNLLLLKPETQNFITIHINEYAIDLILSGSPFLDVDIKELVAQIVAKQKCKNKLPTWFKTPNIYYPNKINIDAIAEDGLKYLKQTKQKYDWIFIDPSRRTLDNKKVFLLNQCTPDLTLYLNILFKYSNNILIKLSPLLDLTKTIKDLKFVKEIHCIAVNNEVKETLFILEKDYTNTISIRSVNITKKESQIFEHKYNKRCNLNCNFVLDYLYEPNAAIMKTGGFNQLAKQLGIYKLHANTNLFTSKELIDFPGRRFKIIEEFGYNKRKIKEVLPKSKANISVRNFPDYPAQLHKKLKIKPDGSDYLFFVTDKEERHRVVLCNKV